MMNRRNANPDCSRLEANKTLLAVRLAAVGIDVAALGPPGRVLSVMLAPRAGQRLPAGCGSQLPAGWQIG